MNEHCGSHNVGRRSLGCEVKHINTFFTLLFSRKVASYLLSLSNISLPALYGSFSTAMFCQTAFLALALLPFSFAQISDNFESGWNQTKWPIYAPDCNQGGVVSLDSTIAHSGKNSIKVAGAGGYCGHIFFGTTAVPSGNVYVRAYV